MPDNNFKKLNPQITEATIGIRNLRTIKLYPLSLGDQLRMTDVITKAMAAFFAREESSSDMAFVQYITELIKDNIAQVITLATCAEEKGEEILSEITNMQASEIAEIIYEENYGKVAKNVQSLFEKVKAQFLSKRPLPTFAKDMDTSPSTSSTERSSMEE